MIQANELRVGNWLIKDDDGLPERVSIIYPTRVKFLGFDHATGLECVSPIPLTPEWLTRAGFELERPLSYDDDQDGIYMHESCITIYQCFHNEQSFNFATRIDDDGEFKSGYGIKYVHQLQNLVMAISGTELEFK